MEQLKQYLTRPVDTASLAFVRIAFGLVMVWETLRYIHYGWVKRYFISPEFYFSYEGFEWIQPWEGTGMYIHFFVMGLLAVFIALGLFYRLSMILFFFVFTFVFLLDKSNYLNHFYLISLLSFLMIFIPAHRHYSLDALLFPQQRSQTVPVWAVWLVRFQLGVAYLYGGLAKLNGDWLRGEPMSKWLADTTDFPVIGEYFTHPYAGLFFSYSGLLLDLLIVPALLWRRTRLWAFGCITLFHLTNSQLFQIGIFPWFMIAATTIFLDPDWCRSLMDRLFVRPFAGVTPAPVVQQFRISNVLTIGLALYVLWQVVFPFRHFAYRGNVSWTEEGHRFSWHMKLRDKQSRAQFYVKNLATDKEYKVQTKKFLTTRQRRKMRTRPDMILQFAHHLEEVYQDNGHDSVSVRAVVTASLNGRKKQLLVDPHTNLAAIPSHRFPAEWITPLYYPLHIREDDPAATPEPKLPDERLSEQGGDK